MPLIHKLITTYARNQWSYPTDEWLVEHFENLIGDKAYAIVACFNENIIGAISYEISTQYLHYQTLLDQKNHGYINEVVVDGSHTKKGLGTDLLRAAVQDLGKLGVKTIYAKRHEENTPSARMMEKCGFRVIDTFHDPERSTGSLRTSVCQLIL